MGTCYKHLTFTGYLQIVVWQKAKIKPAKMVEMLGVYLSAIYRKLKSRAYTHLNSDLNEEERYSSDLAEQKCRENLKANGAEFKIDHEYKTYLVAVEKYVSGSIFGEIIDE